MLTSLKLSPLQERRTSSRLIFFFKVAEGLVPALPPTEFLQPARQKRQIKAKSYTDCITTNIIEKQVIKNDRGFTIRQCKTEQLKQSFFVKTCQDWNHLENSVVHAQTVESFKTALHSD